MDRAEAILNHIGPAIKARREAVGRSLEEVAVDAGTSKSHIWALEQGRSKNPTILMLLNVCEALSTTLNSLLGVDVSQPVLTEQELELVHQHRRIFARSALSGDANAEREG